MGGDGAELGETPRHIPSRPRYVPVTSPSRHVPVRSPSGPRHVPTSRAKTWSLEKVVLNQGRSRIRSMLGFRMGSIVCPAPGGLSSFTLHPSLSLPLGCCGGRPASCIRPRAAGPGRAPKATWRSVGGLLGHAEGANSLLRSREQRFEGLHMAVKIGDLSIKARRGRVALNDRRHFANT